MALKDVSHVFALSGSYVEARIRMVENSVSTDGNYSSVSIYIDVHRTNTGYSTSGSGSISGWINDTNGNRVFNISVSIPSGTTVTGPAWVTFYAVTVNVSHNSVGNGSVSVGVTINWQRSGSGSTTFALTYIPRAATISNVSDFNDEQNPSFNYSNPGGYDMECWLEPHPNGEHYAIRTVSGTSGTFTWNLTDEERDQLRSECVDANSCTIRVGLYSNNKTWASYKDVKFSIINADPIFTTPAYLVTNHQDLVDNKTMIQGYSNISVTVGAAIAQKEATMKSYKVTVGDVIKTSDNAGVFIFENIKDSVIKCYAEDSRGNTTEKIVNITDVIAYNPPLITELDFERDEGGIGTGVDITLKGTMWNESFTKAANTITAQYFYKEQGASDWIQGQTPLSLQAAANLQLTQAIAGDLGANGFDNGKIYDAKVIITDKLANCEKAGIIPTGIPGTAYHVDGFCVHGFYNEDEGGPFQIEGKKQPIYQKTESMERTSNYIEYEADDEKLYIKPNSIKKHTYMVSGTSVVNATDTGAQLHTWEYIQSLFEDEFGFVPTDQTKLGISLTNGDAASTGSSSTQAHVEGATWIGDTSLNAATALYVVFDRAPGGNVRINYSYFYNF